jgi:hypothetical protein
LFAVVIFLLAGIFKSVIDGQRSAISAQNTQESMRYALEIMSKEIRTAKNLGNACLINFGINPQINKIFHTSAGNDILYFQNKNNICVAYSLVPDGATFRLKFYKFNPSDSTTNEGYITPDEIRISNLSFTVSDNLVSVLKSKQPKVTIKMDVEMAGGSVIHKQKMKIQTAVSSRNYNEF